MNGSTKYSFRSGTSELNGCRVDRVLRVSTAHMPDLNENLAPWLWGVWEPDSSRGWEIAWIWAYEEDPCTEEGSIPEWLLNLCIAARECYGCNWILLDPEGSIVEGIPSFEHRRPGSSAAREV
jgi:hypothetical protein